jgi:hypothetical protein
MQRLVVMALENFRERLMPSHCYCLISLQVFGQQRARLKMRRIEALRITGRAQVQVQVLD